MKREIEKLEVLQNYDEQASKLNQDIFYICYFKYKICFSNFLEKPALLIMWLFYFFGRKKGIDHVAYISNIFKFDDDIIVEIFDSTIYGTFSADLRERLKHFKGELIVEDVGAINKKKLKEFEDKYIADGYSVIDAVKAGVDGWVGKKLNKIFKKNGNFCSELVGKALKENGVQKFLRMSEGDLSELTPDDIWEMNLGAKKLIFKQ